MTKSGKNNKNITSTITKMHLKEGKPEFASHHRISNIIIIMNMKEKETDGNNLPSIIYQG